MTIQSIVSCYFLIATFALGGNRTGGAYTVSADANDAGGSLVSSYSYYSIGSIGGVGKSSTSEHYSALSGYPAQIDAGPQANAGADATVPGGEAFTLDGGTSSDPEGLAVTYAWTQLSGLPLLANPPVTTASIPFTAPFTPGTATFQLTVTDPAGKTATDTVTVTFTAPVDANSNGLPDRWEETQPPLSGGADDDDDLDGTSNHFEFQAGTNPADPASVFKLVSSSFAPPQATLRFRSGIGRNYQLQHSTNLTNWLPVPGHETIPGTHAEIEVTATQGQGFYRVAVKQDY